MSGLLGQISHILFDLDGLLINTESCYTVAFSDLANQYGKEFTWDLKVKCMGVSPLQSAQIVINELDLPLTPKELNEETNRLFCKALKDVQLMPGAEKLVRHLHIHNIPMAIATGSDSHQFAIKTEKHKEFFRESNFFKHSVLAADDPKVKRGKPFPDVFIEAMKRFESGANLKPDNVLVFEDSPLGVEAALAAGMPCVWVPDPRTKRDNINSTLVLESLEEFKPQLFDLLESTDLVLKNFPIQPKNRR